MHIPVGRIVPRSRVDLYYPIPYRNMLIFLIPVNDRFHESRYLTANARS